MRWPVTEQTDVPHQGAHHRGLMLRHEITHCIVEMKCNCDCRRSDDDPNDPIKNGGALHNKVPVSFSGRYFERACEIRNTQFCPSIFWPGPFSSGRYLELAFDRS